MASFLKIAITTWTISLIGTLPLGALNVTAFGLVLTNGITSALLFAAGAILSEVFYVRITLSKHFVIKKQWLVYLTPVLIAILVAMGIHLLMQEKVDVTTSSAFVRQFPFFAGVVLSAINPLQVPFWVAWNTTLQERFQFKSTSSFITPYLLGAGLGSFTGFLTFILIARLFLSSLQDYVQMTNLIIAIIYFCFAAWIGYRLVVQQIKFHYAHI
ncbi:MAG: hypothetical protein ACKVOK_05795 [Flavobacteriales bacterium]